MGLALLRRWGAEGQWCGWAGEGGSAGMEVACWDGSIHLASRSRQCKQVQGPGDAQCVLSTWWCLCLVTCVPTSLPPRLLSRIFSVFLHCLPQLRVRERKCQNLSVCPWLRSRNARPQGPSPVLSCGWLQIPYRRMIDAWSDGGVLCLWLNGCPSSSSCFDLKT